MEMPRMRSREIGLPAIPFWVGQFTAASQHPLCSIEYAGSPVRSEVWKGPRPAFSPRMYLEMRESTRGQANEGEVPNFFIFRSAMPRLGGLL